jgi:hypothetical protein
MPRTQNPGRPHPRHPGVPSGWTLAALGLAAAAVWQGGLLRRIPIAPAPLHLHCAPPHPPEADEPVSVLLPVRHEAQTAVAAVRAALGQRGIEHLDIVVLDDGCPAETRAALRREFADDPRVRILAAAALPRGWSAPAHRSHQLAVAARGRVLLFTEPCAPLGPRAAAAAAALLRRERLHLAVLDSGRPAPASPFSAFHPGRFALAVDAAAYWSTGGYRASPGASDPLELLRTVRRARGRVAVADARRVIPPAKRIAPLVRTEPHAADTPAPPIWEWPDSMSAIPPVENTQDGESISQPLPAETSQPSPSATVRTRA